MVKIVSLWNLRPGVTPEEFERHYLEVHVPLVKQLPGLKKYTLSKVRSSKTRKVPFYRMVHLCWEDIEAIRRMTSSPEDSKVASDEGFFLKVTDLIEFVCEDQKIAL